MQMPVIPTYIDLHRLCAYPDWIGCGLAVSPLEQMGVVGVSKYFTVSDDSNMNHRIQGGAPHVQCAHHVVARLPHAAAAPPCTNQVAAVFRRTPTACSANPDQHRQAGFQHHCTVNVERSTELRSPK